MEDNENEAKECIDEDVHDVDVDAQAVLQSFDVFDDRLMYSFPPFDHRHLIFLSVSLSARHFNFRKQSEMSLFFSMT